MADFALPAVGYGLLALFGVGQMAIALVLFTIGVRLMQAPMPGLSPCSNASFALGLARLPRR